VIPWTLLAKAPIPGGGELRLMRRGGEFSIRIGAQELMNSRRGGSEEALATIACGKIAARARPRLLIGGLGMGFTLRAALRALDASARVEAAELVAAVVQWAQGPMAEIFAGSLNDPRVKIEVADVAEIIRAAASRYDAILLDVDNGPEAMTRAANDRLYDARGLAAARAALKVGGVLAVWSARPDRRFAQRLGDAGFAAEEFSVRARGGRGARHTIWIAAARPAPGRRLMRRSLLDAGVDRH